MAAGAMGDNFSPRLGLVKEFITNEVKCGAAPRLMGVRKYAARIVKRASPLPAGEGPGVRAN